MSRRSPKSDRSFGSRPAGQRGRNSISRGELIRDRYSTDRYPTAEDFIRAVERNPEHFDPSSESFFPHDYGQGFTHSDKPGLRGVSGTNLKGNRPNGSNWIADNPIEVDASSDPGSVSVSVEAWNNDQGDSVSVVAGVDLIPMGIDINVNGDVGTIAVDLGMPGDAIGVTVGASFDTETGEVIGGQLGLAGGGLSVNVNQIRKDGETCTTVTVTYMGIGTAYQRCRKDDEDDEKDPKKDPPPNSEENDIPDPTPKPIPPGYTGWVCPLVSYTTVSIVLTNSYWTSFLTTHTDLKYIGVAPANLSYPIGDDKNPPYYYGGNAYSGGGSTELTSYVLPETYKSGFLYADPEILDVKKEYDLVTTDSPNYQDITGDQRQFKAGENCFKIVKRKWADWFGVKVKDDPIYYHGTGIRCYYVKNYQPPEEPKEPDPPIPPEDPVTCCDLEPVMSMLRKLNQALAVDEVVGQGLELPNEWILPTAKGHTKMNNYLQIAVFLAKMQDHLGVHPLTVQIADLNAGQEGNQEFKKYYPNGTKAIQEILTILHDENSDSADRLNLQMRLAVLNTRIFLTVASISRSLRGIFQFLGIPMREKREAVPLPFDFTFGLRKGKGFSGDAKKDGEELENNMKKLQDELNKNTENATEALLAKFLVNSEQPFGYESFDSNLPDLLDRLKQIMDKK